jgi:hypothetical protein
MGNVRASMLTRFSTLYGAPRTDEVEEFVAEYVKALGWYSDEVLVAATDDLIKQHTTGGWPRIAVCLKACQDAARKIAAAQQPLLPEPVDEMPAPSEEQKARVQALVAEFKRHVAEKSL